jgi:hypothetical protein
MVFGKITMGVQLGFPTWFATWFVDLRGIAANLFVYCAFLSIWNCQSKEEKNCDWVRGVRST